MFSPEAENQELFNGVFENVVACTKQTNLLHNLVTDDLYLCQNNVERMDKNVEVISKKLWNLLKDTNSVINPTASSSLKHSSLFPEKMRILSELNDSALENIYHNLDIANGIDNKAPKIEIKPNIFTSETETPWNLVTRVKKSKFLQKNTNICNNNEMDESINNSLENKTQTTHNDRENNNEKKAGQKISFLTSSHVMRPQLRYNIKSDTSRTPFDPMLKIKHKFHALPEKTEKDLSKTSTQSMPLNSNCLKHPYHNELESLKPHPDLFKIVAEPRFPKEFEQVPLVFVSTVVELENAITELKRERIIAVDLEHHSFRSYLGITCLIQISTRHKDYLVDPFTLWNELNALLEVFADPNIIKVFHGANKDVQWLQRDFSLYIVNLFDTFFAAEVLGLPVKSLAYLLNIYCKVEAQKEFQLADWRIRPLTPSLVNYARSDTHYLIYIYERMKNDILCRGKSLLLQYKVQDTSIKTTKTTMDETKIGDNNDITLTTKRKIPLNNDQENKNTTVEKCQEVLTVKEQPNHEPGENPLPIKSQKRSNISTNNSKKSKANDSNSNKNSNNSMTEYEKIVKRESEYKDILERRGPDGLMHKVFERSRTLCQMVYQKPCFTPNFYEQLLQRYNKCFNARQFSVLLQLNEWRDGLARREDESTFYVLPNQAMIKIAETLPQTLPNLLTCCIPNPSPLVKQNMHDILSIIKRTLTLKQIELDASYKELDCFTPNAFDSINTTDPNHAYFVIVSSLESTPELANNTTTRGIQNTNTLSYTPKIIQITDLIKGNNNNIKNTPLNKMDAQNVIKKTEMDCSDNTKLLKSSSVNDVIGFEFQTPSRNHHGNEKEMNNGLLTKKSFSNFFNTFNGENAARNPQHNSLPYVNNQVQTIYDIQPHLSMFTKTPYQLLKSSEQRKIAFIEEAKSLANTINLANNCSNPPVVKETTKDPYLSLDKTKNLDDIHKGMIKKYKKLRPFDKLTHPRPNLKELTRKTTDMEPNQTVACNVESQCTENHHVTSNGGPLNKKARKKKNRANAKIQAMNNGISPVNTLKKIKINESDNISELRDNAMLHTNSEPDLKNSNALLFNQLDSFDFESISYDAILHNKASPKTNHPHPKFNTKTPNPMKNITGNAKKIVRPLSTQLNSRTKSMTFKK